jgi:hypothetical protein
MENLNEKAARRIEQRLERIERSTTFLVGRPPSISKMNRSRFNTMLDPKLKIRLAIYCAKMECTLADVIDLSIREYLDNNPI